MVKGDISSQTLIYIPSFKLPHQPLSQQHGPSQIDWLPTQARTSFSIGGVWCHPIHFDTRLGCRQVECVAESCFFEHELAASEFNKPIRPQQ